ncbi:hypothetical protein Tco_1436522, partial [Tanacetum coccineum]
MGGNLCTIWMGCLRLNANVAIFQRSPLNNASNENRTNVLNEFPSKLVLEKFKSHVGVGSWFASLQYACNSFTIDERVAWVDIENVPLKAWMTNTFTKISSKWGELLFEEDKENLCLNKVPGWLPDFMEEEEGEDDSDEEIVDVDSEKENS